jgi:ribose transport system permease protein
VSQLIQPPTEVASDITPSTYSRRSRVGELLRRQEATLILVILVIGVIVAIKNPIFLSSGNLLELGRATVIYLVMAVGGTLLLIGGGLDFSIGSVFTLGGLTTAGLSVIGVPWPLAILGGLAAGALIGLLNAFIIEKLGVPPIIATLGTFYFVSGGVVVISNGNDIPGIPEALQFVGQGSVLGIPLMIIYGLVIAAVLWIVLEKTVFGYDVRAVGGGRPAALTNGIRIKRVDRWLYVICALCAAAAGIIYAARTGSGQVQAGGANITLEVTSAILIGGASLFGGIGNITGSLLGAILLAEIDNGLALANVSPLYESMVVGAILILAVSTDYFRRGRLYRR